MKIDDLSEINKYLIKKYPDKTFYISCEDRWIFSICDEKGNLYANWDRDKIKTLNEIKKIIDSWEE